MSVSTDNPAVIIIHEENDKSTETVQLTISEELNSSFNNGYKERETKNDSTRPTKDLDFDVVIGHIEDMLIDDDFHKLQMSFLEKYWEEFVDTEENKHIYMTIFMEYTHEIEAFINTYIKKLIPHFEMEALIAELERRRDNLDGEVFEVLFTLSDFNAFKEMFLDYRMMKEGSTIDLGQSLFVSPIQ